MDTEPITAARLAASVVAVPPLARRPDFTIDVEQNSRLVKYLENDGITTLLYGGNESVPRQAQRVCQSADHVGRHRGPGYFDGAVGRPGLRHDDGPG